MAVITINGREFPAPNEGMIQTISTNVSSGRNALGEFVGEVVGRNQYKLDSLQWTYLKAEDWQAMLTEFDKFVVLCRFYAMDTGTWKTLRMYPGNRTAEPMFLNEDSEPLGYKNCKVNIVDCGVIN